MLQLLLLVRERGDRQEHLWHLRQEAAAVRRHYSSAAHEGLHGCAQDAVPQGAQGLPGHYAAQHELEVSTLAPSLWHLHIYLTLQQRLGQLEVRGRAHCHTELCVSGQEQEQVLGAQGVEDLPGLGHRCQVIEIE